MIHVDHYDYTKEIIRKACTNAQTRLGRHLKAQISLPFDTLKGRADWHIDFLDEDYKPLFWISFLQQPNLTEESCTEDIIQRIQEKLAAIER